MLHCTNQKLREKLSQHPITRVDRFLTSVGFKHSTKRRWFIETDSKTQSTLRACLGGARGPQIGEVTCGGTPHLSCKRDQI